MKTIITYGTYDLFHVGHLRLLKRARALGNALFVGISTDRFNLEKGKNVVIPYSERAEIVRSIKYVDDIFPEDNWEQKRSDIKRLNADIFVMGDDWEGSFDDLRDVCEVRYLARTPEISTTIIKSALPLHAHSPEE